MMISQLKSAEVCNVNSCIVSDVRLIPEIVNLTLSPGRDIRIPPAVKSFQVVAHSLIFSKSSLHPPVTPTYGSHIQLVKACNDGSS